MKHYPDWDKNPDFKNRDRFVLTRSLFFWGMLSHILLNAYWLSMILVDGAGNYVTFTASDSATVATFLLWSTMYHFENNTSIHSEYAKKPFLVFQMIFCAWNVIWWTLWSGNIFINLMWGVTFAVFTYMIFYNLAMKDVITKSIVHAWVSMVSVLFIFQILIYVYEINSVIYILGDYVCAIAWITLIIMFAAMAFKDKKNRTTWLYASMLYSLFAQYMSDGIIYSVFVLIETLLIFGVIHTFDLNKGKEADI